MSKFGRTYSLSLEVAGGQKVEIGMPITVEFEVRRETASSSQDATIRIYNLGERLRDLIYKDRFNTTEYRAVQLRAGYENFPTPLIFNGVIREATSERIGTEFITTLDCYDGGYAMANSYTARTFGAGATRKQIMEALSGDLKGTTGQPIIGNFPGRSVRGSVYLGNTWSYLVNLSDGYATLDNGQLKVLQPNEAIRAEIPLITAESGLLGSPRRSSTLLEFSMLFEPRFSLGQIVGLESTTNSLFNGSYKVMGFTHRGIVSPAVGGDYRTEVQLWRGTEPFQIISGNPVT